ncbi:MAG: hypothetical protein IKA20_01795 [Clostridia bacterium]|nr:hypothetical protein [Clostridia bacterium]
MADRKHYEALYQSIARDLYKAKAELLTEIKASTEQLNALEEGMKSEGGASLAQEIRYLQKQNQTVYVGLEELVNQKLDEIRSLLGDLDELKYSYQQLQTAYEGLSDKLDVHNDKVIDAVSKAVDYDRIIGGTVEQVVQSMPCPEKIDYARIEEMIAKSVASALNVDAIAEKVAEKLAEKEQTYEVVLDEDGINEIAEKVAVKAQAVDYDRISAMIDEKLVCEDVEEDYELVMDDEGISAIAKAVAEELRATCGTCECAPVEEVAEEPVVEEAPVEEPAIEEPVVEEPVIEELAVAVAPVVEAAPALVSADDGLVQRLKKSFTAKMKQSEDDVKEYYSALKNELTSYKKINSNVSWHGDRFNFGRDTIAKITIVGKTLNLYLDLNPNDPEFKTTVYHQKDVGNQKAYESTPFMVKIKSDAALKKALRLVGYLAAAKQTDKEENFQAVNYVAEFAYASDEQLIEEGFIKVTQEKKVALDF